MKEGENMPFIQFDGPELSKEKKAEEAAALHEDKMKNDPIYKLNYESNKRVNDAVDKAKSVAKKRELEGLEKLNARYMKLIESGRASSLEDAKAISAAENKAKNAENIVNQVRAVNGEKGVKAITTNGVLDIGKLQKYRYSGGRGGNYKAVGTPLLVRGAQGAIKAGGAIGKGLVYGAEATVAAPIVAAGATALGAGGAVIGAGKTLGKQGADIGRGITEGVRSITSKRKNKNSQSEGSSEK
jgi:hypothetical protein